MEVTSQSFIILQRKSSLHRLLYAKRKKNSPPPANGFVTRYRYRALEVLSNCRRNATSGVSLSSLHRVSHIQSRVGTYQR